MPGVVIGLPPTTSDPLDWDLVADILFHAEFEKTRCPHLTQIYDDNDGIVVYDANSAWEFHQLLYFT